jgi:diguanylate cyclase (GGDEF)-like protein
VREITGRKQTEQLREFRYSQIRAIQDVSLHGILVVDSRHNVLSQNRRFSEIWKLPAAEVSASPTTNINPVSSQSPVSINLSLVKDPSAFIRRIQEINAHPEINDQCEIEFTDGRTIERYSTSLRSEEGKYLGRVWFYNDITERKLSERRLQEAYHAIEELAITDSLTTLANRRRFDQYLANEWRRSMREHKPLSLLLFDVDMFKSYNDTYGHLRGDSCLKQVSESIQDVLSRPGDLAARFGGEEFAVVLPDTDSRGAMRVANNVRLSLNQRKLPHSGNSLGIVTISIGCATMIPALGQHAITLTEMADAALYKAKRQGRNRACSGNEAESDGPSSGSTATLDSEESARDE